MKKKNFKKAWDSINPDEAAKVRMLENINSKKRTLSPRANHRLIVLAAAVGVLVFATALAIFTKLDKPTDSGLLNFAESDFLPESNTDWDESWGDPSVRQLSSDEKQELFGDLDVTGTAVFKSSDNTLATFEGVCSNTKILLNSSGSADLNTESTILNDVSVKAAYKISGDDISYATEFEKNGYVYSLTTSGSLFESKTLEDEITEITDELTAMGTPQVLDNRFTDILGFSGYYMLTEKTTPSFYLWRYYTNDGVCIAELTGYSAQEPAAYVADLDGDGITELICNAVYGDGAQRVVVFRNNNGVIERGTVKGDYLISDIVAFDPDTQTFTVNGVASELNFVYSEFIPVED